jgi:hypothetical protein
MYSLAMKKMVEIKIEETIGLVDTCVLLFICTHTNRKNSDDPINSAIRVPNTYA